MKLFKLIWIGFCILLGAAIGTVLLGFDSTMWMIIGAVVGAILGWAFARFVPAAELLSDCFS